MPEIIAGPQDKPSYDFKFYADGFRREYLEERKRLCRFPDCDLCALKKGKLLFEESLSSIYYGNYRLSNKLNAVQIPDFVSERSIRWNAVSQWRGGGYYIGMIKEEYERSKTSFHLYKERLESLRGDTERRVRLLSWCRGILKSLYVFEQGLAMLD